MTIEDRINKWQCALRNQRAAQDDVDQAQDALDEADKEVERTENELAKAAGLDVEVLLEQGIGQGTH